MVPENRQKSLKKRLLIDQNRPFIYLGALQKRESLNDEETSNKVPSKRKYVKIVL